MKQQTAKGNKQLEEIQLQLHTTYTTYTHIYIFTL